MNDIIKGVLLVLAGLFLVAAIMLLTAFPMKWLWNWLMPELFNLKEITYWQAYGMQLLCMFLFKSSVSTKSKDNF